MAYWISDSLDEGEYARRERSESRFTRLAVPRYQALFFAWEARYRKGLELQANNRVTQRKLLQWKREEREWTEWCEREAQKEDPPTVQQCETSWAADTNVKVFRGGMVSCFDPRPSLMDGYPI